MSEDPGVQAVSLAGGLEDRCKKVAKSLRLTWPVTLKDLVRASHLNKIQESKDWENLASQGHGVRDFRNDPLGNAWLYDPTVLSSSRYTDALRLRTNTFGVVALRQANKTIPVSCRRCHEKTESLGQVLGECVAGKGMRIQRHDKMAAVIASKCEEKGYTIARKQLFSVQEERLKPDLVVTDGERALIVDVTVRFESGDSLARGAAEKIAKYQSLADYFVSQGTAREAQVLPIVVGSRGAIPKHTLTALTTLGLDGKRLGKYLAICAVGSSVEIACMHLDYT